MRCEVTEKTNSIGYACMNLDTRPASFHTCRLNNLTEDLHKELIEHNLDVLDAMIDYNVLHGVKLYRISSSIIPFASSDVCTLDWGREFQERFVRIGEKIRQGGMRVSVHAGQYTVINSPNEQVVKNSIRKLNYHADLLDRLRTDNSSKIVLHIGGTYGDTEAALRRFVQNYGTLSPQVRSRLVIELDDKRFDLQQVLKISSMIGAPVVYDNHHHLFPSMQEYSEYEILEQVISTWREGERPKMHYSQQSVGKSRGAHSPTVDLERFAEDYQRVYRHFDIDIMLETNDKNRSFKKVDLYLHPSSKKLQEEWARYKYLIMSISYEDYRNIRLMFQGTKSPSVLEFYRHIDASLKKETSLKNQLNTFEHMWGYFKKQAEEDEKYRFFNKMDRLRQGMISPKAMIDELHRLAEKYEEKYILSSYLL